MPDRALRTRGRRMKPITVMMTAAAGMKHDVDHGIRLRPQKRSRGALPRAERAPRWPDREPWGILSGRALFGRATGRGGRSYVHYDMTDVLNIDPRIARRCLHAGLLQAGA